VKADVWSKIRENISSEGFYSFYGKRRDVIESYSRILRKNPVPTAMINRLKKAIPGLSKLSYEELEFSIDILRERDRGALERVEYVLSLSEASVAAFAHLLFLIDPKSNPPSNGIVKTAISSEEDYAQWLEEVKSIKRKGIQDYIMLESALCFKKKAEDDNRINERIRTVPLTNHSELERLRAEVRLADKETYSNLRRLKTAHPYVGSVLFSRTSKAVIIDGSNIVFSKQDHPDMDRLDDLFLRMSRSRIALFPFRIVFDGNIAYTIGGFQQERLNRWLVLPQVETYSPADDRIIQLARQEKAVIITYDRFMEYDIGDLTLLKPEEIDENLRL
jgi:hypothetical protein